MSGMHATFEPEAETQIRAAKRTYQLRLLSLDDNRGVERIVEL
jgi:hypothetical protein